jgi:hypothetical protein
VVHDLVAKLALEAGPLRAYSWTMSAPATSQPIPGGRPARPPLPVPRSLRDAAAPASRPPAGPPTLLSRAAGRPRRSGLAEVGAGILLLAVWAWLWSTLLAGVVAPGARLGPSRPDAASAAAAASGR